MADDWLGKEMLRQAELRVAAQATALAAMEGRSASLINLCGAGTFAAAAAVFTADQPFARAALASGLLLFAAAIVLLFALRARPGWTVVGIRPSHMADYAQAEQDACLRAMAQSLDDGIPANSDRLDALGAALRRAERLIVLAPVVGSLVVLSLR